MKKVIRLILFLTIITSTTLRADEGMWLPILKKYTVEDMKKKGFKLTAKDLYDINHASLKDAIVQFGNGCTGEVVSSSGLLFTNHHCGYSQIQAHSSVDNNYLDNGFWAKSYDEELPNPGLTVKFLQRMEDVSDIILKDVDDKTPEKMRDSLINMRIRKINADAEENGKYLAITQPIYYGNQYILYVYKVYKDVRLVGTPPDEIGKFGGDTDNWMWPRHTGDFSVFRIYVDKNNEPAEYSPDNVPLKPIKHLKISTKGYNKNDFTFIYGFPGRTSEYLPSYAVEMIMNHRPHVIKLRTQRLNIINADMASNIEIRIKYASKQAGIANAWKKWQGEYFGLKRLNAVEKKRELEKKFERWCNQTTKRDVYKNLLEDFKNIYAELNTYSLVNDYYNEAAMAPEIIIFARSINRFFEKNKDTTKKKTDAEVKFCYNFFKNYSINTDKKIFIEVIKSYYNNVPAEFHPNELSELYKQFDGDFVKIADKIYSETKLTSSQYVCDAIKGDKQKIEQLKTDIAIELFRSFDENYKAKIQPKIAELNKKLEVKQRLYMRGLMEMQPNFNFYPDANSTLRIAYGKVEGFEPVDGTIYKHYTTLKGIVEKNNLGLADYKIPDKLIEFYKTKQFGEYANENGELPIAFLASNHTTGGNSGSPILNASGELLGLNFDRCWESTMSDIMFDPDYCRNISVDIRYVLFIIGKYSGAKRLIDELDFAR